MTLRNEFEDDLRPHVGPLRNYCFHLTASRWEAEDLLQEALLRAFQLYRTRGGFEYPRTLLFTIARNLHIDTHRRRKGGSVQIGEALQLPHYDPNYVSVRGLVEWIAAHLSEREVEMLMLAEVFRYTYRDIAERLDCTVPAVKMVLHRSKRALRRIGGNQEADASKGRPAGPHLHSRKQTVERWTTALMTGEV
jgi:RNA polymerase sigma-70 factor (ECF subfamily)